MTPRVRKINLEELTMRPETGREKTRPMTSDLPSISKARRWNFSGKLLIPLLIILPGIIVFSLTSNKSDKKPTSTANANDQSGLIIENENTTPDTTAQIPDTTTTTPDTTTSTPPDTSTSSSSYGIVKQNDVGYLNVRADASTSATLLGKLDIGDKVSILKTQGDWLQIKLDTPLSGKTIGWVAAVYVEVKTE